MKTTYLLILSLFILSFSIIKAQNVVPSVQTPFITSYRDISDHSLFSYDDLVIMVTDWGFAFFNVDNGSLSELSRLYTHSWPNLARNGNSLYTCNCDTYVECDGINISEIDISQPLTPQISTFLQIDAAPDYSKLFVIDNYLFLIELNNNTYYRIDLDHPENYDTGSQSIREAYLVGNYLLTGNSSEFYTLYENSTLGLQPLLSDINLEYAHNGQNIQSAELIDHDLLVTVADFSIVIWDISDPVMWDLLDYWQVPAADPICNEGQVVYHNNAIHLITEFDLFQLHLSGDHSISSVSSQEYSEELVTDETGSLDNIFFFNTLQGFAQYDISSNEPQWLGYFYEFASLGRTHINDDQYFVCGFKENVSEGIYRADISDPLDPQMLPALLIDDEYDWMQTADHFFFLLNFYEYYWDVYYYLHNDMLLLETLPFTHLFDYVNYFRTDPSEPDAFYVTNMDEDFLQKYMIANNSIELVIDVILPDQQFGFVQNGYAYCISQLFDYQDIYIYSGLNDNIVFLENQYSQFIGGENLSIYPINENFFYISDILNINYIIGYDNAELTGQTFSLPSYSKYVSCIFENYLVSSTDNIIYFYEFDENTSGAQTPVLELELIHDICKINLYENQNGYYLFCSCRTAVSVVEVVINNGSIEWEIIQTTNSVTAQPNPFLPAHNLEISFSFDSEDLRSQKEKTISVYNLKGQLVHQKNFPPANSINWNGVYDNGKKAPSGVYFYNLKSGSSSACGKFVISR